MISVFLSGNFSNPHEVLSGYTIQIRNLYEIADESWFGMRLPSHIGASDPSGNGHQPPATLEKSYLQLDPFVRCIYRSAEGLRYLTSTGWAHHPWSGISINVAYWLLHSSCEDCCRTFGNVVWLVKSPTPARNRPLKILVTEVPGIIMAWCPNTSDHHWRKKRSRNEYLIRPSWRLESTLHCCSLISKV